MADILVHHVSKRFLLRRDRADSVGKLLVRMIPGRAMPPTDSLWALRDVSFHVPPGKSLGIVGNNGSGKSTLLKLLTHTLMPTEGRLRVQGRTSALIELGAGFHPDFTGRENIILNASILGISRREIERRMDDVIEFSEIRPFIDSPVKYYSSGMYARLGFAVAINVSPEILIVDEVLAVGDESFQQKCMDRIFKLKREGVSILLVSHSLGFVEQLMDMALWIDQGAVRAHGLPSDVVRQYRVSLLGEQGETSREVQSSGGILSVTGFRVLSEGRESESIRSGSDVTFQVIVENNGTPCAGHLSISVRRPDGLEVLGFSSLKDGRMLTFSSGGTELGVTVPGLYLATGTYEIDAVLMDGNGRRIGEWRPLSQIRVQDTQDGVGILRLPHEWRVG